MNWLSENKQFIEELKTCSFFSYLFREDDIICIYLGGSRSNGIIDDKSDYDIVVLTLSDPEQEECMFSMTYKGRSVHWYYRSLYEITNRSRNNTILSPFSGINLTRIEDHVIYINNKYKKYYDWIIQNKRDLVVYNCWEFVLTNPTFINVCSKKKVTSEDYNKYLYHMCNCKYIILSEEPDIDFLVKLKRIRYTQDSSLEEKTYQILHELQQYRLNNDIERKERHKRLNDSLNKLKQEVN